MDNIREDREYTVNYRGAGGSGSESFIVNADTEEAQDAQAMKEAEELAEAWLIQGDYGDEGARVSGWFSLEDADSEWPERDIEVEIEPNHSALIRAAMNGDGCGDDPDNHDWTSEGEGGCDENPGVWGGSGTSLTFLTHCATCGLRRREFVTGSQYNPGDHDTTEYFAPDPAEDEAYA